MLKSMTGYGSVNAQGPGFDVHVEIKTLNSKFHYYIEKKFSLDLQEGNIYCHQ